MSCLLEKALEVYTRDAGSRGFSKTTVTNTSRCIRRFCSILGKEDLAAITGEDLKGFIVAMRDKNVWDDSPRAKDRLLSATSINTYVRAIRAFWGWLAVQKLIETNFMANIPAPKTPRTVPKVFSLEDLARVIEAVDDDPVEKVIIFIFIDAGIRLGGLVSLNLADADLEQGQISVKGKGGKDYTGYITKPTVDALKVYLKDREKTGYRGERLLVSPEGKPISASWVQQRLEEIGKRAGLNQRLSPHKLRHTYATLSLKYGLNMDYLRRTMGHADIETTSKSYINAADQDVARAHRSASPLAHILNIGQGNLPGDKEAETEKQTYKETAHKKKMRLLARALADQISPPSLWDTDLLRDLPVDFKPGRYSLPFGVVEIGKDKQIKVQYEDINASVAEPHLVKGLYSHLGTSGPAFAELTGDKGKIGAWRCQAGKYARSLLILLGLITDDVKGYKAEVSLDDAVRPGLTRWFIVTIWRDALSNAGGHAWIESDWYKPHESIPYTRLWQLKCGSYIIGIANDTETLKTYEQWHRQLRAKYASSNQARDITASYRKLDEAAQDIRLLLHEFSDAERLPGRCGLC